MQSLNPRDAYVGRGSIGGTTRTSALAQGRRQEFVDDEMPRLIQLIVLIVTEAVMRLLQLQLERIIRPALKSLKEFLSQ